MERTEAKMASKISNAQIGLKIDRKTNFAMQMTKMIIIFEIDQIQGRG